MTPKEFHPPYQMTDESKQSTPEKTHKTPASRFSSRLAKSTFSEDTVRIDLQPGKDNNSVKKQTCELFSSSEYDYSKSQEEEEQKIAPKKQMRSLKDTGFIDKAE